MNQTKNAKYVLLWSLVREEMAETYSADINIYLCLYLV